MKCLFFTDHPNAAASQFYADALKNSDFFSVDYSYELQTINNSYDIVFVMTYDHLQIKKMKQIFNEKTKFCLIDPRNNDVTESANLCDFLIVDSIEMEDYWRKVNKPIFRYIEYPDILADHKLYTNDNKKIKIGYHGNLIHLDCMSETVTPAIEELAKDVEVEFIAMLSSFNQKNPAWMPKGVKFTYIPWSMKNYSKLGQCDIGIVPNNILQNKDHKKLSQIQDKHYNYSEDDYSLRFKMPSNPGRIIIFGLLGIPVIADFYPSAFQILDCKTTGYVANSKDGWLYSFKELLNPEMRRYMGKGLQNFVLNNFTFQKQNLNLKTFMENLIYYGN